jgi:DHA1 family bicyclomycin/chloramphenicol resistance-like MFS transporter
LDAVPRGPLDRRWLLVLGTLSAFGPVTTDAYLPGLPQVRGELDVGAAGAQLTLTTCLLGLAFGQLVVGPVSDAVGRRRPLLAGLALFVVASGLCAVAPSAAVLDGARLLQGLAGAAGIVLARAMVRDTAEGVEAVRTFSTLGAVNSVAPVLAPLAGSALLHVGSWRGVFAFLAVVGLVLLAAAAVLTEETLPPARRRPGRLRDVVATYAELLRERRFAGHALAGGLAFGALFTYIASASFVYHDAFGFLERPVATPAQARELLGVAGA